MNFIKNNSVLKKGAIITVIALFITVYIGVLIKAYNVQTQFESYKNEPTIQTSGELGNIWNNLNFEYSSYGYNHSIGTDLFTKKEDNPNIFFENINTVANSVIIILNEPISQTSYVRLILQNYPAKRQIEVGKKLYRGQTAVIFNTSMGRCTNAQVFIDGDFSLKALLIGDANCYMKNEISMSIWYMVIIFAVSWFLIYILYKFLVVYKKRACPKPTLIKCFSLIMFIICLILYSIGISGDMEAYQPFSCLLVITIVILLFSFFVFGKLKLHQFAVIAIIILGTISIYLQPIFGICDEPAHFARSELVSRGQFLLDRQLDQDASSYSTIQAYNDLNRYKNYSVKEANIKGLPISTAPISISNVQTVHMFIFYIPQAIGVLIAKVLKLDLLWLLWLGRFCNLVFYALIVGLSIKLADRHKFLLFYLACCPMCLVQSASYNPDASVFGLCFLLIGYFIHLFYSDNKITRKEIVLASLLCVAVTFAKFTNFCMAGLFFALPMKKFSGKKQHRQFLFLIAFITILATLIATLDSLLYATPAEYIGYYQNSNVDPIQQIRFILSNPINWTVHAITYLATTLDSMFVGLNWFGWQIRRYSAPLIDIIMFVELAHIISKEKPIFSRIWERLWALFLAFAIYAACAFTLYVSWTSVGADYVANLTPRYLIPAVGIGAFAIMNGKEADVQPSSYTIDIALSLFMLCSVFFSAISILR